MLSTDQIMGLGGTPVSTEVLDQSNHNVYQKECAGCMRIQPFGCFKRDASYREGVRDLCISCETSPRLSTEEHTDYLRQKNYNSQAVKSQRWENQLEYVQSDECRTGTMRSSGDIYSFLHDTAIDKLYFMDGRIVGDISIFRVYGCPQPHLDGRTFEYLMYMPSGLMPEFSLIEYGPQDQPIRERKRGWRTVLLRLIRAGVITEKQVDERFGKAVGLGAIPYNRQLWKYRNQK